jgi:xanthine dehydrogenase accessory factor
VLAAGTSSRMGRSKALVRVGARTMLTQVLENLRDAHIHPVVVVLGRDAGAVRRATTFRDETVVVNPDPSPGMSSSLRVGLRAVSDLPGHVMIVLADQPFVRPATLEALARRASAGDGRIFIPTFRGIRGNPVLFDRNLAPEVAQIEGDVGCRAMFPNHPSEIREVPVDDPGVLVDIDTPAELALFEDGARRRVSLETTLLRAAGPRLALHAAPSERRATPTLWLPADVGALSERLRREGQPFALATVVRVVRPTSGRPGYKAVVRPDGSHVGWVGGMCTEDLVVAEARNALREGTPRLLRVTPDERRGPPQEGVVDRTMVCESGGTVEIYIEPNVPKPNLLIVGDSPVAASLAALGPLLGYHVTLVAAGANARDLPSVDTLVTEVEDLPKHLMAPTYAIVATMGRYDELALARIAVAPVAFVGLVASRKRAASVLATLREDGLTEGQVASIRNPVGLDISAESPEEIALSIMAELTQVRRTAPRSTVAEPPAASVSPDPPAIDPVCHMEVDRSTPLRATHAGTTYYFCADSCRRKFVKSPARYLP